MLIRSFVLAALVPIIASSPAPRLTYGEEARPAWSAPRLERVVSIRDGRTGKVLAFHDFLDALAEADVVFLGETHDDETTHRLELAIYEGLLARRKGRVVLAMEMFERDVQRHLDSYLAGESDEATFLAHARPWANYPEAYRPLVERARQSRRPVVAANFPRALRMRVAREGARAIEALPDDARHHAPRKLLPHTDAYWRRVDNAVRGHHGMMRRGSGGKQQRLYSTQSLWDNTMGESCAIALDKHPGHLVLHVNGDFHSLFWDGAARQLALRKPEAQIKTVSIEPVAHPASAEWKGAPRADYVVFAHARAQNRDQGRWSVQVARGAKYRFHLPDNVSHEAPVPLLIWLSDDGLTAADGLDLWKDRLGKQAAIAVLEAPYREVQQDLSAGGRWFWADTFSADVSSLVAAVDRIWAYLLRHYPIDPDRVCLAGEGTGATVASAVTLLTDRMDVDSVSVAPRRYAKLKDFPLPLPELWGDDRPPERSLRVIGDEDVAAWWNSELAEYTKIGLDSSTILAATDPWQAQAQIENQIRGALKLDRHPMRTAKTRGYLLVEGDSPRTRHWSRLQALWAAEARGYPVAAVETPPKDKKARQISTEIHAQSFASADALPHCPGPFGGTTIVVLSDDAAPDELKGWLALQENDPLARESRFHRLRVATGNGDRSLQTVLEVLASEQRKNVLIVPAVFCADAMWMRTLKRRVRDHENQMTIHWVPGLGGRRAALSIASPKSAALQTNELCAPCANSLCDGGKGSGVFFGHTSCQLDESSTEKDSRPPLVAATRRAKQKAPVRHALSVKLVPATHRLIVQDKVELPPSWRREGAEFTLNSALKIKRSDPPVAKVASDDDAQFRYALQSAPVDGVVNLSYEGVINFGLSAQKEEYTRGFRETRGTIGPQGVYLDGDSAWVPRFDDRLVRFAINAEVPNGWHLVSSGDGNSREANGHATWDSIVPTEEIYLVGGPLVRESDTAGAVEVLVYLHQRDDALARKYLDATARYLEMYRGLIGPYPYGKFALVENFWETGYGMPSFTLLGPKVIRFPFILHSSYPHEILHNWWGNSVFVDYQRGNWCEGLTAYLADHLIQQQRGKGAEYRRNTLQKYRDYVQQGRDFPLSEFRARHSAATEAVGYGKALMTFHMLRRHLGDDAFRAGLAGLYRKHRGRRASFDDVRRAFEATSDKDLDPFFSQWIERTGAPELAVDRVTVSETDAGFLVKGYLNQMQPDAPFALEVPAVVQTAAGQSSLVIPTQTRRQAFELPVTSRPQTLSIDPRFDVFRMLDPRETPASIGQLFGQPRVLAVLPASSADERELDRYRKLINGWSTDDHAIELALDTQPSLKDLPADRAVWVLGRQNRFARELAVQGDRGAVNVSAATIQLGETDVPFDDHSIVVVQRHPRNPELAIGWLAVEPVEAFPGIARKLPHYGKYSYLAFEGSEPTNTVKGQWNASGSPLLVDLRQDRGRRLEPLRIEPRQPLADLPPVFSRRSLLAHVHWLSSPQREGRGLGTQGLARAADYIAKQMADAGLSPGGDKGSWFQRLTVPEGPEGAPVETVNVVGVLPGRRADWSDQSVVLGAHYDHLGHGWPDVHAGDEGQLHPGADDNASGVAVLLELARRFAAEAAASRNLVVVAFSAEECGRHGSRHYLHHPRFPAEGIRAAINLDTVGRLGDRKLAIHGTGTADQWPHIFRGCSFVTAVASQNVPEAAGGSDQMSFIEKGIPAVQIFTGAHADYHRPTDTPDKIDGAGLVKVATFVKEAVAYLLEREEPLSVRIRGAAVHETAPREARKVLFGTVPAYDYQGDGVKIESLVPGSPAARAGLRGGDVLIRIDDQQIANLRSFAELLRRLKPGQQVVATVRRGDQQVTLRVKVEAR